MGFGISTPQQAWRVGELADGVVESATLRLVTNLLAPDYRRAGSAKREQVR